MSGGRSDAGVKEAARGGGDAVDRTRPPEPGELRPLELPEFDRFRLDNGLRVWVGTDPQIPEVSVRLVQEAGAHLDPGDSAGTAELTGELLTEGAGDRSALEMAEWLDRLGAGFGVSVGYDSAMLSLHSLSDTLEGGLDYLRSVAREPTFAEEEVERVRQELVDEMERERDEADIVADHAFIRAVFGSHRFGLPASGTPESVAELDREAVVDFHARRYGAEDAAIVVCGDVEVDRVRSALEERFGDWTAGNGRSDVPEPSDEPSDAGTVVVVDRPGSAQAEIRTGTVGLGYGADGFYESIVGNAVLGGLFNSRFNMNLREEKGWTYGAYSSFHYRRVPGPFVGRAAVETGAAAAALRELVAEIRGMWEDPPGEDELGLARNSLVLSLPRKFETVHQVSRKVATQVVYDLPEDYWERYRDRIEAVIREEVVEVMRDRLRPESLVSVVVAEADAVVPALEESFDRVEVRPAP